VQFWPGELGGAAESVIANAIEISGTYAIASSPRNSLSFSLPNDPYTGFTGRLIEVLRSGVNDKIETITLGRLYNELKRRIAAFPTLPGPQQRNFGEINEFVLAKNIAWASDPDVRLERLEKKYKQLLEETQIRIRGLNEEYERSKLEQGTFIQEQARTISRLEAELSEAQKTLKNGGANKLQRSNGQRVENNVISEAASPPKVLTIGWRKNAKEASFAVAGIIVGFIAAFGALATSALLNSEVFFLSLGSALKPDAVGVLYFAPIFMIGLGLAILKWRDATLFSKHGWISFGVVSCLTGIFCIWFGVSYVELLMTTPRRELNTPGFLIGISVIPASLISLVIFRRRRWQVYPVAPETGVTEINR
jgi:hypothetical protein